MKDLLLGLISSYENRVEAVENLILNGEATTNAGDGLAEAHETREKLRAELRETLVRNCSLRRKDFDAFTSSAFANLDGKRAEIEQERKLLRERLKTYLSRQKKLITSLKGQLGKFVPESSAADSLEAILSDLRASMKGEAEQMSAMLRLFQSRFEAFREEQEGLNNRLQEILEKGQLVKLEDIRVLQTSPASERGEVAGAVGEADVVRLLTQFDRVGQESVH